MSNTTLQEWTIAFVKHRDLTFRKLEGHTITKNVIHFKFKERMHPHIIMEELDATLFEAIKGMDFKTVVCLNTESNFKFLTLHWKKLAEIKNLTLIFVNLKNNDKWMINPHMHSMIADPASLETGLKSMFDTANGKIIEIKQGKKKSTMFEEHKPGDEEEDPEAEG